MMNLQKVSGLSNIYCVTIPIPVPLKYVNCYLIGDSKGWTIIDTGFHNEETEIAWKSAFKELKIDPKDVSSIVVTHAHPDHFGSAGWLQAWTGAQVAISDVEWKMVNQRWMRGEDWVNDLISYLQRYGLPESQRKILFDWEMSGIEMCRPYPEDFRFIKDNETIEIGDRDFRVMFTPGHSPGHMIMVDENDGLAFIGDQVLSNITPHIGKWEPADLNPLGDYLDSLA
jgi:glyoxylase-like metal-dependent hydrolase (beta-lactamase superfamily II)